MTLPNDPSTDRAGAQDLRNQHADWIEAIATRQDRTAFTALFEYFAPRVKAYLVRMRLDQAQAEDLMQDVMTTLWRKAASYDRRQASVSTWVFRIARNRRIDLARKDARSDYDPYDPSLWPAPETPADEQVEAGERDAAVAAAIETLPEEQLELVRLAFFSGMSHSEIAAARDLPLGTVKSRLRLALGKIKVRLGEAAE